MLLPRRLETWFNLQRDQRGQLPLKYAALYLFVYLLIGIILGLLIGGLNWFASWFEVHPHGSNFPLFIATFLFITFPLVILVGPVLLIVGLVKRKWLAIFSGACFLLPVLVLQVAGLRLGEQYHERAFYQLAQRSQPLIQAIQQYEQTHGQPPQQLSQLVPNFISTIPRTGLGAYPDYEYVSQPVTPGNFAYPRDVTGNDWLLYINTGSLDFDIFIYLPNQQYPTNGLGGAIQRIGDWAYVHE